MQHLGAVLVAEQHFRARDPGFICLGEMWFPFQINNEECKCLCEGYTAFHAFVCCGKLDLKHLLLREGFMCPEERICYSCPALPPITVCTHKHTHTHICCVWGCAQKRQMQDLLVPVSQFCPSFVRIWDVGCSSRSSP